MVRSRDTAMGQHWHLAAEQYHRLKKAGRLHELNYGFDQKTQEKLITALTSGQRRLKSEPDEATVRTQVVPAIERLVVLYRHSSRILDKMPTWREEKGNLEEVIGVLKIAIKTGNPTDLVRLFGRKGIPQVTRTKIIHALIRDGNRLPRDVDEDLKTRNAVLPEAEYEQYVGPYLSDRADLLDRVHASVSKLGTANIDDLTLILTAAKSAYEHYFKGKTATRGRPPTRGRSDFLRDLAETLRDAGYKISTSAHKRPLSKFESVLEIVLGITSETARDLAKSALNSGL